VTTNRAVVWGAVGLRLVIGAVLIYASLSKIAHPDQFADAVANYRLLPPALVSWTAIVLPWLELVTGACLIAGVAVASAALVSLVMFAAFTGALLGAQARHLDIACGCFNVSPSAGSGGHSLWVTLALAVGSLGILLAGDRASIFSVAALRVWSAKAKRRTVLAVMAALAGLLVVTLVAGATGRDTTNSRVARGGALIVLARGQLTSKEALAGFAAAQPAISVHVIATQTAADTLRLLDGGARPDVVEVSLDQVPWLVRHGYIQPIHPKQLSGWSAIPAALRQFPGVTVGGVTYAAPLDSARIGIIYRTDRVKPVPTSLRDVFAPRFSGRAAMQDDAATGISLGAAVLGWSGSRALSAAQLERVVRLLKPKTPQSLSYYRDAYGLEGLVVSDLVDIASGDEATARRLSEANVPVAFAVPREGLLVRGRGLAIAAHCRDVQAAYDFIAYALAAASASPAPSAPPAAAGRSVQVRAPSSWEAWKAAWNKVVPPQDHG
jgi:spermidine/putrescine-binding protein/uncharacterized membrane protein YphA (DoxX/SURF4 family)